MSQDAAPVTNATGRPESAPLGSGRAESVENGRVLVVAPQPFYEDRGTPIAVRHVLRALSELGYSVDLLTFPLGSSPEIPGVNYIRVGNPLRFSRVPVSFSFRKVFLDVLLAWRMLRLVRSREYRVIHAVEEACFLAVMLRPLHGTPVIYDMNSSLPQQLALLPVFRWRPVQRCCRLLERWLLRKVDSTVASRGLRSVVTAADPDARVREWVFPAVHEPSSAAEVASLRRELDLPEDVRTVVYTGTFAAYQGVDQLLEVVPEITGRHPDVCFVLVGAASATELERVRRSVPERCRDRIRLLLRQEKERIPLFLELADLLVSPRVTGENIPLKIFEYLAAGKPILATDIPAHRSVLDESTAVLVPPTSEGLLDGLDRLLSDRELGRELASACRRYARERLSWKAFVRRMDELVDPLAA